MARLRYNGIRAELGAAISTTGQTSITFVVALESMGANIPTLAAGEYLALVVDDEIVYLTSYTSGATSGTILREVEGTVAATHDVGATVLHAPTTADYPTPATVVTKTAAYTARVGDLVLANAASASFNITLPAAPVEGSQVSIKKTDATGNHVFVYGQSGALVEFDAYAEIVSKGAGGTFVYYAPDWYLVSPTRDPGSTLEVRIPSQDDIPAVPNAFDEEFSRDNVSTIPSSMSWINQGTATYLERYGAATITIPQSTLNVRGLAKTMPAGSTWDIITKVVPSAQRTSNFNAVFLGLRNPAGQLYQVWADASRGFFTIAFNSPTSFNSQSSAIGLAQGGPAIYLRMRRNSATSYDFGVSRDGRAYQMFSLAQNPFGVSTWDQVMIGVFTESNDAAQSASFEYLRKVA